MNNQLPWVILANSTIVKIFRQTKPAKIEEVITFQHADGKLHNLDLVTAPAGRRGNPVANHQNTYESHKSPKQVESEKFAKDIVNHLKIECQNGNCHSFILFASPAFMGVLRKELGEQMHHLIVHEVNKDITHHPIKDIEKELSNL